MGNNFFFDKKNIRDYVYMENYLPLIDKHEIEPYGMDYYFIKKTDLCDFFGIDIEYTNKVIKSLENAWFNNNIIDTLLSAQLISEFSQKIRKDAIVLFVKNNTNVFSLQWCIASGSRVMGYGSNVDPDSWEILNVWLMTDADQASIILEYIKEEKDIFKKYHKDLDIFLNGCGADHNSQAINSIIINLKR